MGRPTHRPRSKSARGSLQERKRGEHARPPSYLLQTLLFSYAAISTRVYPSHPNREYKLVRARVVLRWGTTREGRVLHIFVLFCGAGAREAGANRSWGLGRAEERPGAQGATDGSARRRVTTFCTDVGCCARRRRLRKLINMTRPPSLNLASSSSAPPRPPPRPRRQRRPPLRPPPRPPPRPRSCSARPPPLRKRPSLHPPRQVLLPRSRRRPPPAVRSPRAATLGTR